MSKQLRTLLLIMAALVVPWVTQAQIAVPTTFRTGVDTTRWITLDATATAATFDEPNDGVSSLYNIGFSFVLGQDTVTQFSVNANGRMRLGSNLVSQYWSPAFGDWGTADDSPLLSAYSMDNYVLSTANSYVKYQLTGTAPHRILVVETSQGPFYDDETTERIHYQVQLYEDSSKIAFVYGTSTATNYGDYQAGIGFSSTDMLIINTSTHTASVHTSSVAETDSTWPGNGRYYDMVVPRFSCHTPTMNAIVTTTDSAYLSWAGAATSWTIEYADSAFVPDSGQATVLTANSNSYAIGGLTPQTLYYYAIKAECADGNESFWVTGSFYTQCIATGIPYFYGFEATDSSASCWDYTGVNPNYATAYAGSNSMRLNVSYNASVYNWAVLPNITEPIGNVMMSFYSRTAYTPTYYNGEMQIGYMTDPSDASTFVRLEYYNPDAITWQQHLVFFPDSITYPANARIAFMGNSPVGDDNNFLIDNIVVEPKPACPAVVDLAATTSAGAAVLNWTYQAASSVNVPESYTVLYAPLSDLSNTTTATAYTTNTTITGLTADSSYKAWVSPSCGDNGNGNGDSITFTMSSLPCSYYDHADTTTIGTGLVTSYSNPFPSIWYYRLQEMLYTPAEMGGDTMNITRFALHRSPNSTDDITILDDVDVYFANVDSAVTNLSTGFILQDSTFKLVKHGMSFTGTDWVEFPLDQPFHYDGHSNLLVVFNIHVAAYASNMVFYYTSAPGMACYAQSDGSAFNPATASGGYSSYYRSDIRFIDSHCGAISTCAAPAVTADSVSDTAARIVWAPGYQETEWDVFYKEHSSTAWQTVGTGYTTGEAMLTGLRPGAKYDVAVMGICEDSLRGTTSFSTECGLIYRSTMPYTNNFTSTGVDTNLPACWSRYGTSSSNYPYITTYNGVPSLYFYFYGAANYCEGITPQIEMSADSLEVTFKAYKSYSGYSSMIAVGVMSDPTQDSTFVPVDTLTVAAVSTWTEMEADLSSYTGTGSYIALRYFKDPAAANEYGHMYISDFQVMKRSSCRKPTAAYASNVTYEAAQVNILDADNTDANGYVLYYGTSADINAATDTVNFTGLFTNISGLQYQTTYHCWVGVQCSEESSRLRSFSFTTKPPCVEVSDLQDQYSSANNSAVLSWTVPTEGFTVTDYIVSWKAKDDTTWSRDTITENYYLLSNLLADTSYLYKVTTMCDTVIGSDNSGSFNTINTCTAVINGNGNATPLPLNGYYHYSYSQSIYGSAALASMGDTIRGVYYHQTSATAVPYTYTMDVYLGSTDTTGFEGGISWLPVSNMRKVADSISWSVSGTGWIYLPFDSVYVRDHSKNLVIAIDNNSNGYEYPYPTWSQSVTENISSMYYYSDNTDCNPATPLSGTRASYQPDIRFDASCLAPTCAAPMLICSAKTANSLSLRWFAGGSETAWTVDYRLMGDTTWSSFLTNTTVTDSVLGGLTNGKTYEVRLTSNCGGTSNYYVTDRFSTECGLATLPMTEDLTVQPTGTYARNCWGTGSEASTLPSVSGLAAYGNMLEMGSGAYLIAPTTTTTVNNLQMHLTYWGTSTGSFIYVGVITDPASIQSFVPIDTLVTYDQTMLSSKTVHFNGYNDTIGNICIYMPAGYPINGEYFIDNIIIDENQNCPDVDSVWASNETATAATVNWNVNAHGTASSYLVEYGPAGFTPGMGTTVTSSVAMVSLSGLTHSTVYDVYVTPICSTGDTMYASSASRFQTSCDVMSLPYSMNFDLPYLSALSQTRQMPACWTTDQISQGTGTNTYYAPQIIWSNGYAHSGRNCLSFYYYAVTALPEMVAPLDTLQVSFFANTYSDVYQLAVGVVDSLTPGFAASFVAIDTITCNGGVNDTITFCGYTGNGQYIAFKNVGGYSWGSYSYIYLDDVKVDYRPSCMPVSNITRDTVSTNMMGISWAACGTPQGYEVEYGVSGFTQGQGTEMTTTSNTATLTGLTAATQYDVYVRSICAVGDTGIWTKVKMTTTPCLGYVDREMRDTTLSLGTTSYIPAFATYNYSYSQVIYDSASMASAGFSAGSEISALAFNALNLTSNTYYDNCRVLMKNTNKNTFSSRTDFDSMSTSNLVYTGTLNWSAVGWRTVEFDSVFVWDGSSNVIVAVDRDDGDWSSSSSFQSVTVNSYRGAYAYNDGINVDPYTLSGVSASYGSYTHSIPVYKFYGCPSVSCEAPAVTVASHTYEQATLTWTGEATNYEVNVKASTASVWPADIAVSAFTYTATALQPATTYNYRVRAICDTTMQSDWVEGTFVTDSLPCFAPTALTADPDFGTATMSWTVGTSETHWNLHVWNTTFDSTYAVSANSVTVGGFVPGVTYNAAVEAACGGGLILSGYSDTISFTTVICAPVTGVTVGTVTGTTAQVSWTAGANNTGSYQIEYGIAGFGSGDGTMVNATTNSATLTGLEGETSYDVYVRAVCDSEYPSVWSDKASFETPNVGIHTVSGAADVTIYPNPATDGTTVSVSGVEGEVSVTIVDMNGRTVSTHTMNCSGDCVKQMNVSSLATGAYFVRIQGEGLNLVKKLVVK